MCWPEKCGVTSSSPETPAEPKFWLGEVTHRLRGESAQPAPVRGRRERHHLALCLWRTWDECVRQPLSEPLHRSSTCPCVPWLPAVPRPSGPPLRVTQSAGHQQVYGVSVSEELGPSRCPRPLVLVLVKRWVWRRMPQEWVARFLVTPMLTIAAKVSQLLFTRVSKQSQAKRQRG